MLVSLKAAENEEMEVAQYRGVKEVGSEEFWTKWLF